MGSRIQDTEITMATTAPRKSVPVSKQRRARRSASQLDFSKPHVLRNATEYNAAVAELDVLVDLNPTPGSEADDRLLFLSVLVEAYEQLQVAKLAARRDRRTH